MCQASTLPPESHPQFISSPAANPPYLENSKEGRLHSLSTEAIILQQSDYVEVPGTRVKLEDLPRHRFPSREENGLRQEMDLWGRLATTLPLSSQLQLEPPREMAR